MKYRVMMRGWIRVEKIVEANSYEEAVDAAREEKKTTVELLLQPVAVGTDAEVTDTGAFRYGGADIIGPCGWCKKTIIIRDMPGQPWVYGGDPHNEHADLVCYACLSDPKEVERRKNA